jgi:sugar phosphate isomerase/epimerase
MSTITTNRRRFLGAAAALSAGSVIPASAAHRSSAGVLKLGVASYSLRKFSRAEAIKMLNTLQVEYVSIKSFHLPYEGSVAETAAGGDEFRKAGISVLSGGNIDLTDPAKNRKMFEYAKAAGIPMMVCAPKKETLDQVEELVKEFDIKIAIHNHGPEDKFFPTPEGALDLLEGRDGRMGVCIDVGHTTRTGTNVIHSIRRAGPKLLDLHIKDLASLMDKDSQVEVGRGAMPVTQIFKELLEMNYQGGVMLEYEIHADNPLPGMIESIAYMRGVLDGLAG